MRATRFIALAGAIAVYVMLWIGGISSSAIWGEAPDGATWAAPVFLYLASLLVIWRLRWKDRAAFLIIGAFGFAIEVVGESTSVLFGSYEYTDTLAPAIWGVPIALASAWIVITAFVAGILIRSGVPRGWWVVAGPILMVGVDLALEPVATGPMNAWQWETTGGYYDVPATNFLGWFIVSIPIFAFLAAARYNDRRGFIAGSSVVAFFLILTIIHLLWGALIATAAFTGTAMVTRRMVKSRKRNSLSAGKITPRQCDS